MNPLGLVCAFYIINKQTTSKLIVREKTNMKNLSMKTLIIYSIAMLGLFGIVRANEVVTETSQPYPFSRMKVVIAV